jgi:pimeloyl-ACP methyl ester carboxylesterase
VALLEWEDLSEVHLVLHSYAGVLAGPCIERSGGRIASVTFVGAFLADDGESLLDVEPPETAERYRSLSAEEGDGWRIPASPAFLEQWGVTDPDLVAWIGPRLTDFPLACATDHVHFSQSVLERLQLFYVHHTDPPLHNLDTSHERAVQRGVTTFDVACGHDVMVEAPEELAGILQRIVS